LAIVFSVPVPVPIVGGGDGDGEVEIVVVVMYIARCVTNQARCCAAQRAT
jgi:uncharacterized membrane protein